MKYKQRACSKQEIKLAWSKKCGYEWAFTLALSQRIFWGSYPGSHLTMIFTYGSLTLPFDYYEPCHEKGCSIFLKNVDEILV
jgi:hypothetical protein